jgi:glycosyltransferase involved in cell wall biosynthesis
MRLLIITPFKNEEQSIVKTMDSIVKQTTLPVKWLMIDDGSDDNSPELVKQYQLKYPFIHYHRRGNSSGQRATGNNVVDVFNDGLKVAESLNIEWDIVSKLDADLVIESKEYLQFLMEKFAKYPKLGIASGVTYILTDNKEKVFESVHRWHTQGQTKFYRKSCLEAMGGLKPFKGWDGIDDILARSKGFITEKFFEQHVWHLYPTQTRSAEGGFKKGLLREATGYRNMGYPFYMYIFKSLKLVKERGLYPGLVYFYYGVKATLFGTPLVNKEEQHIVKNFMLKRWKNDFSYTTDQK